MTYPGAHPSGYGHLILVDHIIGGREVTSGYAHMYGSDIHVRVDDRVTAGQHIADVGSYGKSTRRHLHFEIRLTDRSSDPTNGLNGFQPLPAAAAAARGCTARGSSRSRRNWRTISHVLP